LINWNFYPLHKTLEQLKKFERDEWAEVEPEYPPSNVNWKLYEKLGEMGAAYALTASENGVVIGYNAFLVNEHIHYPEIKTATQSGMYLYPAYRKGFTGINLVKKAEAELKAIGINKINYQIKTPGLIKILKHLGYEQSAILLTKRI